MGQLVGVKIVEARIYSFRGALLEKMTAAASI